MSPQQEACRSREGAWIEMGKNGGMVMAQGVAPARERGLKYQSIITINGNQRRSREGAWIEIP